MRRSCYDPGVADALITVDEAGRALGKSRSTIWRLIRRGELPSVRQKGRRLIRAAALRTVVARSPGADVPAFSSDHPIFRLVGAGRGGGRRPGARDKHAILDR